MAARAVPRREGSAGQTARSEVIFEDMPARARPALVPPSVVSYWKASRAPRYSVLFALPLLLLYEAMAAFLPAGHGPELRNGADVLLWDFFLTVAGRRYAPLVFGLTLIGFGVWLVGRDLRSARAPLQGRFFLGMAGESLVLALCFGSVVGTITAHLVQTAVRPAAATTAWAMMAQSPAAGALASAPAATRVMLSLGAGLYEELLFRVILVSGIALIARRLFGWRPWVAGTVAVSVSALTFAAFHYIGPYGDPLQLDSFVFRLLGGIAFSVLYVSRGFGITAWTHACYDLLVLVA
jgi:hypothetical protein